MKTNIKNITQFLLATLITLYTTASYATTINVDVIPSTPTTDDFIVANIFGEHNTPGFTLDGTQLDIVGNLINIDVFVSSPLQPVLQPPKDYFYFVDIGRLDIGLYDIVAELIIDTDQSFTASNTFTVSSLPPAIPVPLPASIWLVGFGIILLVSYSRQLIRNTRATPNTMGNTVIA